MQGLQETGDGLKTEKHERVNVRFRKIKQEIRSQLWPEMLSVPFRARS